MLDGIRIIDLTMHLAGPYCTWLLGHLGADVIKVERPGGDPARKTGPIIDGESVYFASVNRNKRSIVLDLKVDEDRAIFTELVKSADALVENYRPGVMDRLGFGEAQLAHLNPRLVFASISGFGQTGPLRDRPAFDIIAQAMSGLMSVTGPEGGPPVRSGMSIGDIASSLFAANGITAALLARERKGAAPRVDVSMLDCQLALLENAIARHLNAGDEPRPIGTRHPSITPFQAFSASDGDLVVAVDGDASFARFCEAIGMPDLKDDPRFSDLAIRHQNHGELEPLLAALFKTATRDSWLARLAAADVACGPLNTIKDSVAQAQVSARDMISQPLRDDGPAMKFAASPLGARGSVSERPAPSLGQHTSEVLAELRLHDV